MKRVPQKSRGIYKRRERKLLLIAVERRKNKTETNYFNQFNRVQKEYRINFIPCNETDPVHLAEKTEEAWNAEGCDAKFGDRAYCVFDTDIDIGKQREIDEAIRLSEHGHFEVILSNPCFEVWFILHFGYTTKLFCSNTEVIKELQKNMPEYTKNTDVFEDILPHCKDAVRNVKRLEEYHMNNNNRRGMKRNPSSEVYRIVKLLNTD